MSSLAWLQNIFAEIVKEAEKNPDFATRLARVLLAERATATPARRFRRSPAVVDPFTVYASGGEPRLRDELNGLDMEQLKDIVAEHGMDQAKLALKWKTPGRLIDLIV